MTQSKPSTKNALPPSNPVDICVIGGGVNGAGIARDAAGRGLSVVLLEKDDLAQGTSSRSGKLVHGGLRYLEYYEFRLVREALIEREVLLASAPHIIWPMRFILPHSRADRPAWLVRAGLFLYDHLGGRKRLPPTRTLDLRKSVKGEALKASYVKAFEFSDCWVDDARLVILNALDAQQRGAVIKTRTRCKRACRVKGLWEIQTIESHTGEQSLLTARCIINAAGPWVNRVIESADRVTTRRQVRLVKGSHIVVGKFWKGNQAYLIQNSDKRVIFINPYEHDKALIGTTDIAFDGQVDNVSIDDSEISYLLNAVNRYFVHSLTPEDVLHSFSGVRPLYDDSADNPSAVTRDYLFDVDTDNGEAPILSVFGGKITTFRKLAEHALDKLQPYFTTMQPAWTAGSYLPGGDIGHAGFNDFLVELIAQHPQLPQPLLEHYARLYGSRCQQLLQGVNELEDLGQQFSPLCFEVELRFLINHEWAMSVDDLLARRTKHALHMSQEEREHVEYWFNQQVTVPAAQDQILQNVNAN